MAENSRLRRVTDLFVRGTEVLTPDGGAVLVWVNKPNAFERDEADKDGRTGRQRRLLPLRETKDPKDRSEELQLAYAATESLTDDELVTGATSQERSQQYLLTLDDIRADEGWAEDMLLLERADALSADGSQMSEEESEAMIALNARYLAEIDKRFMERMTALEDEIRGLPRDQLVTKYVETWRQTVGLDAFEIERWKTQLFYALRECDAAKAGDGWDHGKCRHPRLLDSRAEVNNLPDGLIELVDPVLRGLLVPPRDAGNSDAPTSSSASLEQPSAEAESTPSTPSDE